MSFQMLQRSYQETIREMSTESGRRELSILSAKVREVESAPLSERQEARTEWYDAMRDRPGGVGERVGWLLDGSYGRGAYLKARQVLFSPRMNRVAALGQMVACVEWKCPANFAAQAWHKLTAHEKRQVDAAISGMIEDAINEEIRESTSTE